MVLISDEEAYSVTMNQNLAEPSNIDETLNNLLWMKSMDDECRPLSTKIPGKWLYLPKMRIFSEINKYLFGNKILKGR